MIDGMAMDAERDIRAPDWATLDLYCDRVASAVGRLSVRIFGLPDREGEALAYHLGRALQLTNILRDIDEDAAIGRLYLPREALRRPAGVKTDRSARGRGRSEACRGLCRGRRPRAGPFREGASRSWTARRAPRSGAPRLMAAAYGSILDRMLAEGFAPPRKRAKASRPRVLAALLRYGVL